MYNSQLLKILKTFSRIEMKELGKYVQSPCFNQKEDVIKLFDFLSKHHGSTPSVFEREGVFQSIFPKKKYDDGLLRLVTHNLLKITKSYLVQKELENSTTDFQLYLAKAMRKRGFDDNFEKEISIANDFNSQNPYRNADFHFKNYQIEMENLEHITLTRRKGDMPFQELFSALASFFIIETLRNSCLALSYQTIAKRNYDVPLLDDVLNWLEKSDFLSKNASNTEGVAVAIYFNTYHALKVNSTVHFDELKRLIYQNWFLFPESECRFIYLQAINFCIKRINSGENQYLLEFFELTRSGLENKRLFENGILSKFTYNNAITVALRLEKYDWVKQFLDEYKPFLHPKDRETAYSFNLANYYYRKKDYSNALKLLQLADFGDVPTNLSARSTQIRIYYEINEIEVLSSLLDSSQTYLLRQKEIGYLKDNYMNLIKFMRKILRLDMKDKTEREKLLKEINETKNIVEKDWLIEKLQ